MVKKFFKTKLKVSTDYLIVSTAIIFGILVMSFTLGITSYKSSQDSKNNSLKQDALKAENLISEIINEHNWQIRSVADKIMKSDGDVRKINQIISDYNKFDTNSNFDQFLNQKDIFWVNSNDEVIVKNKIGILEFPQKISKSYEVFNSKEEPWKLVISKEIPYFQNDYSLILTSFGVTDQSGKYLGSIVSSIDINLIQNALISQFRSSDNSLIIVSSHDGYIVSQSSSKYLIEDYKFFAHKLGNENYEKNASKFLDEEIVDNELSYSFYKKLANYPLVVLTGYNQESYKNHLIHSIIKSIYPSILIGCLLIVILFLFYKRILKPINHLSIIASKIGNENSPHKPIFPKINSPEIFSLAKALISIRTQKIKEKEHYLELERTKEKLEEALEVIKKSDLAQIEIIKHIKKDISKNTAQVYATLKMLRHNAEKADKKENTINLYLIKTLEQGIENITKFATDELNKDHANIRSIINRALTAQKKEIKIRNIKLDVLYDKNTPKLVFVDQIRLIQVVSAIIQKTVPLLSSKNLLSIHVKSATKNKTKKLSISVIDDGMGIGFKDYESSAKQIGKKDESSINGIDISVETIEDLVKLHQGEIVYKNEIHKGSNTTIIIPYVKKVDKATSSAKIPPESDKIIPFPTRNHD
jgi:hypothetical protein